MIPLHLSVSGFLSYREPVELDFTGFDLACIAGSNGAGKSSLLDAITWALFGQARKRDDSLINTQCSAAEVCLTFAYEGNVYRVQRNKPRDKTTVLEFHILQGDSHFQAGDQQKWKPLTERTLRETEALIQRTLRLDYETFVNAAFFLQGKADQFTQQRPGDRKRILGSILGLEVWESYRRQAVDRRKRVEDAITALDGRLQEISVELAEEEVRKRRLKELEEELERLGQQRALQESALENIRKIAATLAEQHRFVDSLARQLDSASGRLDELEARRSERFQEKEAHAGILAQAEQIEAGYEAWQAARAGLERWEKIAERFREQEKRREGPRDEINTARARLRQELQILEERNGQIEANRPKIQDLKLQIDQACLAVEKAEERLAHRAELDAELQVARQRQAEAKAENPRLKNEMDELKERIDQLTAAEGAVCPLCGQPLSPEDRRSLIETLMNQGLELGDRYRANSNLLKHSDQQVRDLLQESSGLSKVETDLRTYTQTVAQLSSQMQLLESQSVEWESGGAIRIQEICQSLEAESFAPEAQARLEQVDAELKAIGYDAAAHDAVRRAELEGRAIEEQLRALEKARAALEPLQREITDLEQQISIQKAEVARQGEEYTNASAALAAAETQAPDLASAEQDLYKLQEQENHLRLEVGAARQKVSVLDDLKSRRKKLDAQREQFAKQAGQYKQLERAFGKDGVPALLIEQALPQIESRANEILFRLSGGNMTVRFVTQMAYKDKTRDDLRETLDIVISDAAGTRDYEMFSGGEAFRVNFAIRLALSEVLAQRAGARLQTLVIDEGFGSQDSQGRQRLIEAINLVRPDFEKILVITHIDELKDVFPTRIEVEKTGMGSIVQVI